MPMIGCNAATAARYNASGGHAWFEQWESKGEHTMRFFIEPVALAVAYAQRTHAGPCAHPCAFCM